MLSFLRQILLRGGSGQCSAVRGGLALHADGLLGPLGRSACPAFEADADRARRRPACRRPCGANQGDPDGVGTATVRINPGLGQICWTISVSGVEPITAAHIHVAPPTAPGPVVVPLNPYTGGCTDVDRQLALAIIQDPDAYYVNVHNDPYPAGALRGQLSR